MTLISRRECHIIGVKNEDLNKIVEEIKAFLKKEKIPEEYVINVYKDYVACCGFLPMGVVIEIEGPEKQPIENLDLKIYAKIIEICERENIEYHECKPLSVVQ
jgi:hypothetical protein